MRLFNRICMRSQRELELMRKREWYPLDSFLRKISCAGQILSIVEDNAEDNRVKWEARKNFIINCVTATEVYFKDIVKGLLELPRVKQNDSGVRELLKEKVSLWEAYMLFKEEELSIGSIIAVHSSFQSLAHIDYTMSKILNLGFLDTVGNHKTQLEEEDKERYSMETLYLNEDYPDWRRHLNEIFELRHDFVHHVNFKDRIGFERLGTLWEHLDAFITVVDDYILGYVDVE